VVVADDELADVGADVRQVREREHVLGPRQQQLARDVREQRALRALGVHAQQVPVDLRLHGVPEVELLVQAVDDLVVVAALQRQHGL
jgi:hypothetical protein